MKFYQQVGSVKKSKFNKVRDDIISIDMLWRHKLLDMTSKFNDVISLSKMSALLWNFIDLLTLLKQSPVSIFVSFHRVYPDLQKYCHSTDVVYIWSHWRLPTYGVLQTTWSQKFFSTKQERQTLLAVKFQVHIISISTNLERVKREVVHPNKSTSPC